MRTIFSLAILCVTATAAPVPKEVSAGECFEGTWKILEYSASDERVSVGDGGIPEYWSLDVACMLVVHHGPVAGKDVVADVQLVFDRKAKTVDYRSKVSSGFPGIYEQSGDTMKICLKMAPQADRPTDFKSGSGVHIWTFKRIEPKR